MTDAFPLYWPDGWPRREAYRRTASRFKVTPDTAWNNLKSQVRLLGGRSVVISTDVPIRQDGQFYSDHARRVIRDPGAAVYFQLRGKGMVMACDDYTRAHENVHALGHAVEHLRGLERHGGGVMLERAFSGFAALPSPGGLGARSWWSVLEVERTATRDQILAAYRRLSLIRHPDVGGSNEAMAELVAAREAALSEPVR